MPHVIRGKGRPKKEDEEKRTIRITSRLTEFQYELLLEFVDKTGMSMSDCIRYCIGETLERELYRSTFNEY